MRSSAAAPRRLFVAGLGPRSAARRALLVAGVGAALLLTGCGAQGPTTQVGNTQIRTGGARDGHLGDAFAGVTRLGNVDSIGAHWQVPAIAAGSQAGRAATWIGAQALTTKPGTSFLHTAFIQVGTREELEPSGELLDEAFWTDTTRGLHPLSLLPVRPGDTVAARMSLAGRRWTLTIADLSTGKHARLSTADEGSGHFRLALWLQEDPTNAMTNRVFAYPDLGPVRMSALTVNGATPAATTLQTTWMKLPHAYLGPTPSTPPAHAAFSVVPKTLSSAGEGYLRIAEPANAEMDHFLAESSTWRRGTSPRLIRSAIDRHIRALQTSAVRLLARDWPVNVAGLVRRFAQLTGRQATLLGQAINHGPAAVLSALSFGARGRLHARLAAEIRARLNLPLGAY